MTELAVPSAAAARSGPQDLPIRTLTRLWLQHCTVGCLTSRCKGWRGGNADSSVKITGVRAQNARRHDGQQRHSDRAHGQATESPGPRCASACSPTPALTGRSSATCISATTANRPSPASSQTAQKSRAPPTLRRVSIPGFAVYWQAGRLRGLDPASGLVGTPRSTRLRLRPLPRQPGHLATTPDELTGATTTSRFGTLRFTGWRRPGGRIEQQESTATVRKQGPAGTGTATPVTAGGGTPRCQ
jgi:hypothetical protein